MQDSAANTRSTTQHPSRFLPADRSPARLGQIALGCIWSIDGALKLQSYILHHFAKGVIEPNAAGQPGFIGSVIKWVGGVVEPHQTIFAALAGVTEGAIGIGLLVPRTVKPALLASFAWALNIWLTGEGLGGLFTGATPDPLTGIIGTAPLYIFAGLLVWPRTPPERSENGADRAYFGLLSESAVRIGWAALWLATAAMWVLPANSGARALDGQFTEAPAGIGWLTSLHSAAAHAVGHSGTTIALVLAVVSAEVGLAVLYLRGTRIALLGSIAISLSFWFLAEGLGGFFTGQATDVGTAPLMILIAALLLPLASRPARAPRVAPFGALRAAEREASRA